MVSATIDHSSSVYHRREVEEESFNLKEWDCKARMLRRERPNSRRYSASYSRSFGGDTKSLRPTVIISSTASSPGYPLKDEINPSTYSFSAAIKALQAKSLQNNWDRLTADGIALNSKWNEAEKYICNPESGEVPIECLSAKTLSGRYFGSYANRIMTVSAPLVYNAATSHSSRHTFQIKPPLNIVRENVQTKHPVQEKKVYAYKRDVGVQSTPSELSPGSLSPARTERSLKCYEPQTTVTILKVKPAGREEATRVEEQGDDGEGKKKQQGKKDSGCLSWMRSMKTRERPKPRKCSIFPTC